MTDRQVKEILDKYYRRRFKEKADVVQKSGEKDTSAPKSDNKPQLNKAVGIEEEEKKEKEKKDEDQKHCRVLADKARQIFEKRKSQTASENKTVLDESKHSKRHASDDDKGASSEDEKGLKQTNKVSKKIKLNLKNISLTSRGNFNNHASNQ